MALSNFTTYQVGVLQSRAYRNLREFMAQHLDAYDYTMMEWALIGLVYDYTSDGGARVSQLAVLMDVEVSLITNMLNALEQRKLIERVIDPTDKRARRIITTRKAENDVKRIEKMMRKQMKIWLGNVHDQQLRSYVKILQNLATK